MTEYLTSENLAETYDLSNVRALCSWFHLAESQTKATVQRKGVDSVMAFKTNIEKYYETSSDLKSVNELLF